MKKLGIFGASGLARELLDIADEVGYKEFVFIDLHEGIESVSGLTIIAEEKVKSLGNIDFVIALGNGALRKKIYEKFPNLNYVNLIHPSVSFGKNQLVKLKKSKGNIYTAGVRLTNNIEIGNFNLFNLNVTIGHDCIIEDFVTISPGANISGNVKLKEGCYIGTGSTVLQGKSISEKLIIGNYSTVGAGAVVVKNVAENTVVKGIPAK